jgi:hypothetical protein
MSLFPQKRSEIIVVLFLLSLECIVYYAFNLCRNGGLQTLTRLFNCIVGKLAGTVITTPYVTDSYKLSTCSAAGTS